MLINIVAPLSSILRTLFANKFIQGSKSLHLQKTILSSLLSKTCWGALHESAFY